MSLTHYRDVCQYGYVHGQCRCIGPKADRHVDCNNPSHAPAQTGKHMQLELPFDPPLEAPVQSTRQQAEREAVLDRFAFHPATPKTGPQHDVVRENHRALAAFVYDNVPLGRHQSLALTALQESMMWCNAAIACDTKER